MLGLEIEDHLMYICTPITSGGTCEENVPNQQAVKHEHDIEDNFYSMILKSLYKQQELVATLIKLLSLLDDISLPSFMPVDCGLFTTIKILAVN